MAVCSFVLDAAALTDLVVWAHWFRWWACAVFTTITSISTDSCLCTRANERNGLTAWANHLNILKTLLKLLPLCLVRNDFPSLGSDSDLQVLPLVLGAVTAWVILTALQHVSVVFFNHSLGFLHCVSNVILEVVDSRDPGIVDRLLQVARRPLRGTWCLRHRSRGACPSSSQCRRGQPCRPCCGAA